MLKRGSLKEPHFLHTTLSVRKFRPFFWKSSEAAVTRKMIPWGGSYCSWCQCSCSSHVWLYLLACVLVSASPISCVTSLGLAFMVMCYAAFWLEVVFDTSNAVFPSGEVVIKLVVYFISGLECFHLVPLASGTSSMCSWVLLIETTLLSPSNLFVRFSHSFLLFLFLVHTFFCGCVKTWCQCCCELDLQNLSYRVLFIQTMNTRTQCFSWI